MSTQGNGNGATRQVVYYHDKLRHMLIVAMSLVLVVPVTAGICVAAHLPLWVLALQLPVLIFGALEPFFAFTRVRTWTEAAGQEGSDAER